MATPYAKLRAVLRMRKHGIDVPRVAYEEARSAGLELAVLCAVLEQETGGGRNVWGHDRDSDGKRIGPLRGGWRLDEGMGESGEVTEEGYREYRRFRDARGRPPYESARFW